jgi:hypothetical protein
VPSSALPDCSEVNDSTLEPLYPNKSSTYQVNGETYKVECNIDANDQNIGETTVCLKPLKLRMVEILLVSLAVFLLFNNQWDVLFQNNNFWKYHPCLRPLGDHLLGRPGEVEEVPR